MLEVLFFLQLCIFLYLFDNFKYLTNLNVFFITTLFILSFVDYDLDEYMILDIFTFCFILYQTIKVIKIKAVNNITN